MNAQFDEETGGYFGLELPYYGKPFPVPHLRFQSGRAALRAALECSDIACVLLPAYICDSVIDAVVDAGIDTAFYDLDQDLYPKMLSDPFPPDWALLYVNYFGLCDKNIDCLLDDLPATSVIIDNTQALFASPREALATIYSPRKFLGVPDGGLLVSDTLDVKSPTTEDTGSLGRMEYLLRRMAHGATDGYAHYVAASRTLEDTRPLAMSRLTARLLASVDLTAVQIRRRDNFTALAARLDRYNRRQWTLASDAVPLCYPLTLDAEMDEVRRELAKIGIYIPTYWKEAEPRIRAEGVESALVHRTLAVPCDQRYSVSRIASVADTIADVAIGTHRPG